MTDPHVSRARAADLGRVLYLYREPDSAYAASQSLSGEATERRFAEVLADEHQETLVAESEGEVVGTLVLAILPNLAHGGAPYAIVENVVVDGARRGRGVGKLLMREAIERARHAGAYKLVLSANAVRARAHEFYRSLGLKQTHAGFEVDPQAS